MIIALLIGREKSIGFPGKNAFLVLRRPMMFYPMMAARHSRYIDDFYFSTDSEDYKRIGRKNGWKIIDRPKELATTESHTEDVFQHGYRKICELLPAKGEEIELVVLLFCNTATILAETIDKGIEILRKNPEYDSAVTVSCYNMWSPLRAKKLNDKGLLEPFVPFEAIGPRESLSSDRDSQGDVWYADCGVSIVRPRCLENLKDGLLPHRWMGQKIYPLKQWGGFDVDFEWQIPLVEYWLKKHGFTETRTPYLR